MYGEEHYLAKIDRNANVIVNDGSEKAKQYINNIKWARDLAVRLNNLDYEQREEAIKKIHEVMDKDYQEMGYSLNSSISK